MLGLTMAYIYSITNTVNGKRYIGKSHYKCEAARFKQHVKDLNNGRHHNSHLLASWRKHGEGAFLFEVIERCDDEYADANEIKWIAFYKSADSSSGYNMTHGGDGGVHTKETRLKISVANRWRIVTAEQRAKISSAKKGKPLGKRSPSVGKKISDALRGHTVSDDTRRKIGMANSGRVAGESQRATLAIGWYSGTKKVICLTHGKEFASLSDAAKFYGVDNGKISMVCSGKRSHTKGLVFKYLEE